MRIPAIPAVPGSPMPEPFLESDFSELFSDKPSLSEISYNFSAGITVRIRIQLTQICDQPHIYVPQVH